MQESGENYLETILILHQATGHVRSVDIANRLGFSKPSISRAMSILKKAGYIDMKPNGAISLTEEGQQKAESVYERHRLIGTYLQMTLGIDPETAERDACRIEHVISQDTFDRIKEFIQKAERHS